MKCPVLTASCPTCGRIISAEAITGDDDPRFGVDVYKTAYRHKLDVKTVEGPVSLSGVCEHVNPSPAAGR